MLWKGFQKPKRLEVDRETLTDHYGRFYAQPFERGFATTVGNSLRRVLLSSIEGAAITAVRVEGVLHEFSPIPGAMEDTTDLILNLKRIPLKMHVEHPKTLILKISEPGEVRAKHITPDPDVEILDPEAYIATLGQGSTLSVEMRVKQGRGYVSADKNFDEDLSIGWIPVDSVHSPIKKVNYFVENARVGQATDYEKLTIEVWTNSAVSPRDAVGLASKLMKDHLTIFINIDDEDDEESGDTPVEISDAGPRGLDGEAQQERRRDGAVGALLQLPQEREHPDHRRARAEDRVRDAQDQELRPQVAQRDQGDPGRDGALPRHEARQLAATTTVEQRGGFGARGMGVWGGCQTCP